MSHPPRPARQRMRGHARQRLRAVVRLLPGSPVADRSPARGRANRAAAVLVAASMVLAALLGLAWRPTSASAAEPLVTVTIDQLTPAVATAGKPGRAPTQRLQITGTLANTSTMNLTSVQVYLWRDPTPITTETALKAYLASDPATPVGRRAVEAEKGTYDAITTDQQPGFVAGQSAAFSVSAELDLLGLDAPGTYPVGVQVRGVRPDGTTLTVGRARTLLSVRASGAAKLPYSPVVVLASAPSLLDANTFADNHLVGELTGRLGRLLESARAPGTTVLVDPSLVDEVQALSEQHTVLGTTITSGQQQASRRVAAAWLSRLSRVLRSHTSYRLPYGNPDLARAQATGRADTRDRVAAALADSNPVAQLPLALTPASGVATDAWFSFVSPLRPSVVFAPDASTGLQSATRIPVVGTLGSLPAGGPAPAPQATPTQLRSLVLAHALLAQVGHGTAPVVTATSDADLGVIASLGTSASGTPITVPTRGSSRLPSAEESPQPADAGAWATAVDPTTDAFTAWGELTAQAPAAKGRLDRAIARSLSRDFASPDAGAAYLRQAVAQMGNVLTDARVRVVMSSEFVLSSATNMLPATVVNSMGQTVHVKMHFTSENPQRISVPDTDVVAVAPHESASLHFAPRASTNGEVTMMAQLETPDGRAIGSPVRIAVRATSFGQVGWVIVVASGVVFMGLTTLRIRQVQRERATSRVGRESAVAAASRFTVAPPNGHTGAHGSSGSPGGSGEPDGTPASGTSTAASLAGLGPTSDHPPTGRTPVDTQPSHPAGEPDE